MSVTNKLKTYKISPKRYEGVTDIPNSALADIAGVLKVMLGDKLIDSTIIKNGLEITVPEGALDDVLKRSTMLSSCDIQHTSTSVQ